MTNNQESHESFAQQVLEAISAKIGKRMFQRFFKGAKLEWQKGQHWALLIEDEFQKFWIESNYEELIREILGQLQDQGQEWTFEITGPSVSQAEPEPKVIPIRAPESELEAPRRNLKAGRNSGSIAVPARPKPSLEDRLRRAGLIPEYSLANFVVGPNSQYCQATAMAVAANPGRVYNPLFYYGSTGLGKTHLMQAIGQEILSTRENVSVSYLTMEKFTNEFITALRGQNVSKFRARYRQVDVLLVDDVQFLEGKDSTHEEFFHTFNTLLDHQKQIVMTSDRAPGQLKVDRRMISRFEWGLTAEIQPPGLETRVAILRAKATLSGVQIQDETLHLIAQNIRSSVRRLEGGLVRVASRVSLQENVGKELRREDVLQWIADLREEEASRAITINDIQKKVAEYFDVRIADMTSRKRPREIAFPRQIAMHLARELTSTSLVKIGEAFGGRDHGTVMHACKLVLKSMEDEETVRDQVTEIRRRLEQS